MHGENIERYLLHRIQVEDSTGRRREELSRQDIVGTLKRGQIVCSNEVCELFYDERRGSGARKGGRLMDWKQVYGDRIRINPEPFL